MTHTAYYEEICYQALMGQGPKVVPHWEYLGCPQAETDITGIDYFGHPRRCRRLTHGACRL